ncbi:MAG: long-chain fatty acid--CoA ligase [Chloroflexota bacterium]
MNAVELLTHRARLTPEEEALVEVATGRRFTFAQINQRACQTAHWLLSMGVAYGDRVSILGHNSIAYVDLFFACGKIGAIFTPLNWRLTADELAWILNNCESKVLVVEPEFEDVAQQLASLTTVQSTVTRHTFDQAIAAAATAEPAAPDQLNGESIHAILYTSGTTGRPKGALIPHRQVLWNAIATATSWELTAADCAPILTPMFHAGGLFVFLTPLIYAGGKVLITKEFDLVGSIDLILQEKCTVVLGVPTIFQMWLDGNITQSANLSSVRYFISGGAPCPIPLIHRWRETTGIALRQGYGMSEVGVNCFSMSNAESISKAGSVGRPIFHLNAQIMDGEGNQLPQGETGELVFKGPQVCAGYLNNPEATSKTIVDDWFRTGDMARIDEDGFVQIVGRFKDMLISGGENVYAAEVESALMSHSAVQLCALVGKPDDKWGEVGVMFVVLEPDHALTPADVLIEYCQQKLARFKVPKEIIFLDELPHSPYGKVEKIKLKKMYIDQA